MADRLISYFRADSLNLRRSEGINTGVPSRTAVAIASHGTDLGFNTALDMTAAAYKSLMFQGDKNASEVRKFSVLIRLEFGYTGAPPTSRGFWQLGMGPNNFGPNWQLAHLITTGKLVAYNVNENNQTRLNSLDLGTLSPTSGQSKDILITDLGDTSTNGVNAYDGTTLLGQGTASFNLNSTWPMLFNAIMFSTNAFTGSQNWWVKEVALWNYIVDPNSVDLESGSGALGTSRTSPLLAPVFNGSTWTALTAAQIKDGVTQTQEGVDVEGTYRADDLYDAVTADELKHGVTKDQDGSSIAGTYRGYDLWDAVEPEDLRDGVTVNQDGVSTDGLLDTPVPADVVLDVEYDNGTQVGTVRIPQTAVVLKNFDFGPSDSLEGELLIVPPRIEVSTI